MASKIAPSTSHRAEAQLRNWASFHTWCGMGWPFDSTPGPPDLNSRNILLEDPQMVRVTGLWLDVERTRTLAEEVFVHRSGIPDEWSHWPDGSTVGIPNYYSWVFAALTQGAIQTGDDELRVRYEDRAIAWQTLGQLLSR